VQAVADADRANATRLVDWDGIIDRSIEGFDISESVAKGYKEGAKQNGLEVQLVNALSSSVANGGSYQLVRVVKRGGQQHAVFRLVDPQAGLNYHDLRLQRDGGRIRADRFFIAATGEEMADTLRAVAGPALQSQGSLADKLSGKNKEEMKALETQGKIMAAARAGQTEEVMRLYQALPKDRQETKMAMLAVIMATDVTQEEAYLAAIDRYVAKFPNDPSIGMITLDAAALRRDAKLLETARKQIQSWTGGDPYVDLLVGGNLASMGLADEAVAMTKDIDPAPLKVATGHDMKLSIALAVEDYATVLKHLRILRDDYGFEFSDLSEVDGFQGFAQSPEFAQWTQDP
jgi:hypothetical protein